MRRRIVVWLVAGLVVLLCAGLVGFNLFRDKMIAQFFATMQPPPQTVAAAEVKTQTWTPGIPAIGTARATYGVELASQLGGVVRQINIVPNKKFKKGDVLVQLEDAVERADLAEAESTLKLAEDNLDRSRSLQTKGYTPQASYEQAQAQFSGSQARVSRLKAVIDQKAIKAPFDGVAGIPRVDLGPVCQSRHGGDDLPGPHRHEGRFPRARAVRRQAQDRRSRCASASATTTSPSAARSSASIRASIRRRACCRCRRSSPRTTGRGASCPASSCRSASNLPIENNIVTVPQTGVVTSLFGDYVYIVADDKNKEGKDVKVARQAFVKTGRREGGLVEITSGLQRGPDDRRRRPEQVDLGRGGDGRQLDRRHQAGARREGCDAMSFTELFIRRPVLAIVVSLLILLMGAQGLMNLAVRQYPKVEETTITITTAYPGASASLMQGFISDADRESGVGGRRHRLRHVARAASASSTVSVRMRLNTDPNAALTEVQAQASSRSARSCRRDAEDPVLVKGTGQSFALMYLTFANTDMNPEQVTEFLDPRRAAALRDARRRRRRRHPRRPRLLDARLDRSDPACRAQRHRRRRRRRDPRQQLPVDAGQDAERICRLPRSKCRRRCRPPESFGAMPVVARGDQIVRLRDVADVELGPKITDTIVTFNGKAGTFIGITPTPSANPLSVAQRVTKEMTADPADAAAEHDGRDRL